MKLLVDLTANVEQCQIGDESQHFQLRWSFKGNKISIILLGLVEMSLV